MPGSSEKGKAKTKGFIEKLNPLVVLDVGPGWGTYSELCRLPGTVWDAVEIHEPYIERFNLNAKYDTVYLSDIRTFEPSKRYDLVIFGDVLEHITEDEGVYVLDVISKNSKYIIISLPLDGDTNAPPGTGDVDWGNINELHVAKWKYDDFVAKIDERDSLTLVDVDRHEEIAIFYIKTIGGDL